MKSFKIDDYSKVECPFIGQENKTIFIFVHQETNGCVCDTGCGWFNGGACPAYKKLTIPAKPEAGQLPQETVKETAKRLGISISEVRRRRRMMDDGHMNRNNC